MSDDLLTDAAKTATGKIMEQMEYELRGAWRAGFDYVHVYDKMGTLARSEMGEQFSLSQYVLPANHHRPPDPPGLTYRYTYDLTAVPDETIRRAIRGEVDMETARQMISRD